MNRKGEIGKKLGIGLSVIFTVFWLVPYIYVICCSFKPSAEVIAVPPSFFPKAFSIENFTGLLERMDALQFLWNSLSVSLISTVIALILGSLAAYAIQRSGAKLSIILVVLVLCLKMIPTSSIVVPIYELICNLGLYDTKIALIIVYAAINMPFVMWTMLSFYEGIPTTLDEAAFVDGASSFKTFWKVILPICKPGLATAFIFTLFLAWNDFLVLKESSRFGELDGKKCPLEAGMTKKTVVKRGQYRSLLQILHRQSHHLQLKSNAYLINRNRSCF